MNIFINLSKPYLCTPCKKRPRCKMKSMTIRALKNELHPCQIEDSSLYHRVLYTHLFKDYLSTKANSNNYSGFTYPRDYI